jgi:tetratricopeptide (TPR) repeat protein
VPGEVDWVRDEPVVGVGGNDGWPGALEERAGKSRSQHEQSLPESVALEVGAAVGPAKAVQLVERLAAAAAAYDRDRYLDALRMARSVVNQVPESGAARELYGLTCYRLGRWRAAIVNLKEAAELTGEQDQLPVLMDCYRALGRRGKVRQLWTELRKSAVSADVLVEGRIVLAGSMADTGDLDGAIAVLVEGGAARALRNPAERHLRQWYALGDLYERGGDIARAREMFGRVASADPELGDVMDRLDSLGRSGGASRHSGGRSNGSAVGSKRSSANGRSSTKGVEPSGRAPRTRRTPRTGGASKWPPTSKLS